MRPGFATFLATTLVICGRSEERQLTTAPHGHVLTNVNAWSPDSAWLVYDVREGDGFNGTRIEQVNVHTGQVQVLYASRHGAHCGVVTYSPTEPVVVFILGPENPSPDWTYHFTRRRGVLVDAQQPGVARPLDAMNYAPPFTPGALRGGSHVHVFSPDGRWVSFTYEDEVLAQGEGSGGPRDPNQRNIGVAVPGAVQVARSHPRNHDGTYFSVLVTRTVASPRPGSDEISRAFEEGWIGNDGYLRPDGTRQRRALAFQGLVTAADGRPHAEVFVVDLPDDLTVAGEEPLEGTVTRGPVPPRGTEQRRLTFTDNRTVRGLATAPRHWLRSSPDGSQIAFLMPDEAGIAQLWTVSPLGGAPRQVTRLPTGVSSAFTWSPDGRHIAHVADTSICRTEIATGRTERLTPPVAQAAAPLPLACVYSPDGRWIAYQRPAATVAGTFVQICVVAVPDRPTDARE